MKRTEGRGGRSDLTELKEREKGTKIGGEKHILPSVWGNSRSRYGSIDGLSWTATQGSSGERGIEGPPSTRERGALTKWYWRIERFYARPS